MTSNDTILCKSQYFTNVLRSGMVSVTPWAGYVLSMAIFAAALGARFAMLPVEGGYVFLTFYPAVAVVALLFGARSGLLTVALSAASSYYFFMPPFWSFSLGPGHLLPLAIFTCSGSIICFIAHQMQQNASELRQSESIIDSTDDAVISKTLDGIITSWNRGAEKLFGFSAGESIGHSMEMLIPQDRLNEELEILATLSRGVRVDHFETVRHRKDGRMIDISTTISPILDGNGKAIGASNISRDITEHKREHVSEERYRRLFESAKDGILILDAETGLIVDANPFMAEKLGYSHEEFLGMHIWDLGFMKNVAANKEKFLELQQRDYVRYEDLPLETAQGKSMRVEFVSNVYLVGDTRVIQCNIRDITERKDAEDVLRKLSLAVEQSPSSIVITDLSGSIEYVNEAFIKTTGYSRAESIGQNPRILHSGKTPQASYAEMWTHLTRGEAWEGELINRRKDGTEYIELMWISPVRQADGRITNYLAINEDITELKGISKVLSEKEAYLHALVGTIPDLIWVKDAEGVYLSCNPMAERFYGAKEADVIGKTDYDFVDKEQADSFREHDLKAMAAGKPCANEEWVRFADDGHRALLETQKTAMHNADGQLIGVLGIARDITQRKVMEVELTDQLEELRRWHDVTSGREERILDLKHEVNELLGKSGLPPRYPSAESENPTEK